MVAFHNRFFIPDASEFFNALLDLLRQSGEDGLEEYQRTIGVMYSRLREYRPSSTEQLGEDMGQLINVIGRRIERLEPLYNDDHSEQSDAYENNEELPLGPFNSNSCVGRPRVEITQEQIEVLRNNLGFKWTDIARMSSIIYI